MFSKIILLKYYIQKSVQIMCVLEKFHNVNALVAWKPDQETEQ